MRINKEKQEIIDCQGNILVTANPGTGKTLLLAHKYVNLIKNGCDPEDVLCLTFTRKARKEMEERISTLLQKLDMNIDISQLMIHTFHSYALEHIEDLPLVSTNLLRYSIFRYLKEHNTLNYGDRYLMDTIVPKMENLIRYLKSYSITPDTINVESACSHLVNFKNYTCEELSSFLTTFVDIYTYYEKMKGAEGIDYTDMLLTFLKQQSIPQFKYVLIDELQDVNTMEADIALRSASSFLAVGDQKQAIFGFQGGSILNFNKFADSRKFVLSENFRSTNAILDYARIYFCSKTKQKQHISELKNLANRIKGVGPKPVVFDVSRDQCEAAACSLATTLMKKGNASVAIIARTNSQISRISKELQNRGIDHSSTFVSASTEAQQNIITFLKGLLSDDIGCLKQAMFTPFFPITLEEAFRLAGKKNLAYWEIYDSCPRIRWLKKKLGNAEDVAVLFHQCIIPTAISYGEEYVLAALTMKEAFHEAIRVIEDKTIENLCAFLEATDLLGSESHEEKNLMVTTVHKSKGRQFDTVIYVPSRTQNRENFQDTVVKAILKSHGINAEEELEEETLRVNFVAFTRAKEQLYVVTDKVNDYLNEAAELKELSAELSDDTTTSEYHRRAFSLFVNKQYDKAKQLLDENNCWIINFVKGHFDQLESLSFSSITTNPYEYFQSNILNLGEYSQALQLGSDVHVLAENIVEGEEYTVREELKPYEKNINILIDQIHHEYPHDVFVEELFKISLSDLIDTEERIVFKGKIDAVFKNDDGEYLIVDWKTSKNANNGSEHRRQLAAYKKAFSLKNNIPAEHIKVAVGYVSLRKTINDGVIRTVLDMRQPTASSFNTFTRHIKTILSWKKDVHSFFDDLMQVNNDDALLRSIIEQYNVEK